ncbi:MAG: RHS repeat protein, partial [Burkholderia sp.]
GRVVSQTGFDDRRQQLRYNAAGEVVEQIDHGQDGQLRTSLLYDNVGHVIERRLADGTQTAFAYDERGLLTQTRHQQAAGEASQITYEYDAAGRRTAETQAHHGRVWRLQHRLDAIGNRSDTHLAGMGTLSWLRYGSGHIHGVLLDGIQLASFERDALHRTIANTQGSIAQLFTYTDAGQIASQHLQDLDERGQPRAEPRPWRTWDYDSAGQLTGLRDAWRGSKRYSYDPLARLINVARHEGEVVSDVQSEAFQYDPTGNLLSRTASDGAAKSQDADNMPNVVGNRLAHFVVADKATQTLLEFAYDGHGNRIGRTEQLMSDTPSIKSAPSLLNRLLSRQENLTSSSTVSSPQATRYRYDGTHQLSGIEYADGGHTEYRYDSFGRRIAKVHTPSGQASRTTLFVWDGEWMLQEVHADATAKDDSIVTYVPHPDHQGPLTRLAGGKRYHYLNDHLGTPQELVDDDRKVVWAADFESHGQSKCQIVAEIDNPIRFPGQYRDLESGLYYNRHRYYDPETGRYINQDPIGLHGGANAYAYADNRPVDAIDPTGLATIAAGAELGAAGGTALFPGVGTIVGGILGAAVGLGAMIWMANTASNSGSQSSAQDRQSEYINAKRFCDTPPPPGSNECSTLSRQIDHAERCIKLYEAWDQKWLPGRHDEKIVGWKNRLQNLKDEHNRKCTQKCPQKSS